ncbi:WPE palindromic element domain-containing protein [Wolbachia endosymbiont (group A) of Anomoia purmunda]|uniref:WPE palindromic element domain-containing protein n=1 Tax=Wolbachia endosymbiont (group A) of Anomoia purmunda TaxID=2953978 RepID=UPI00222E1A0B|nr:WPE palindromic element domain-containing protein [Wolbachia endosymbiont (group A) of Anomoia purmunda]
MPQTQRQCPDYLDPEDLISTQWLHNKGWIPVPSTGMTPFLAEIVLKSQCSYSYGFIRGVDSANT